jgi:hypothetical protein
MARRRKITMDELTVLIAQHQISRDTTQLLGIIQDKRDLVRLFGSPLRAAQPDYRALSVRPNRADGRWTDIRRQSCADCHSPLRGGAR